MGLRRARVIAGAAVIVVLSMIAADAALADGEVSAPTEITVTVSGGTQNVVITGGASIAPTPVVISPQCIGVTDGASLSGAADSLCIGSTGQKDGPKVIGAWDPFIAGGFEAKYALRWMVNEAVTHLRLHYGLPLDNRIERFGGSEIRAYLVQRILGILDKSVHGIALTNQEQLTLRYVQGRVLEADRRISDYAYGEYQNWKAKQCGYSPPPAPSFVAKPVLLPDAVSQRCRVLQPQTAVLFNIAPPTPSVSDFLAWGFYKHAQDAGISALGDPGAQELLQDMLAAGVVLGSFAAAATAGAGAAALVGSSAALSAAVATAMGSTVTGAVAAASYPASALGAMIGSTAASAAGWVVAIVVVGIVVTAVSIVLVVQNESVGVDLLTRKKQAEKAIDPFNLVKQHSRYGNTPIGTGWDKKLPAHRSTKVTTRLRQLLLQWTTVDQSGVFHPDGKGVWPDNATDMSEDLYFEEKIDDGGFVAVPFIQLPQRAVDGPALELRFDGSWPILTAPGGQPNATLTFPFVDADGALIYASRLSNNTFVLGNVEALRSGTGEVSTVLNFRDSDARLHTVRLVDPHADSARGPGARPAAAGMMLPGRPVILRPNPVNEQGAFYPLDQVDDFDYEWTVEKFDPVSGGWASVANLSGSSPTFVPDDVGNYSVEVTRTGDQHRYYGNVDFEIAPPDIDVDVLRLEDDGYDKLKLFGRFSERVTSDELKVTVRWPGSLDVPEESLPGDVLICGDHNGICSTTAIPDGRLIGEHDLDLGSVDLHEGVVVTVSNSWGVVAQRTLTLDASKRPQLQELPALTTPESDAKVDFDNGVIYAQVPIETDRFQNLTLVTIQLPEAQGSSARFLESDSVVFDLGAMEHFSLAPTGEHTVELRYSGIPASTDLGLDEYPLTIVAGSSATSVVIRRDVVAAVDDRFRAAVAYPVGWTGNSGMIPGLTPIVLGGNTEWGGYDGDICVELTNATASPPTADKTCAPLSTFANFETGTLNELSLASLLPNGLRHGLWRVKAWLPSAGVEGTGQQPSHASALPTQTTFRVDSDAPVVALSWSNASRSFTRTTVVEPGAPKLRDVVCTLDDSVIGCFEAGDRWVLGELPDGLHELHVMTTDDSGNYTTTRSTFRVGEPPAPVPGMDDGTVAGTPRVSGHGSTGLGSMRDGGAGAVAPPSSAPTPTPGASTGAVDDPDSASSTPTVGDPDASDSRALGAVPWPGVMLLLVLLLLIVGGGIVLFRRRAAGD